MITELERRREDGPLEADVCILGAGAAGITIACALVGSGARTVLLESGGRAFDQPTQDLYRSEVVGLAHGGVHGYRFRVFGGSTTRWAGQALPLAPIDFAAREWVPGSGWPLRREELEPFYRRAAEWMRIPPFPPGRPADSWPAALGPPAGFDPALVEPWFSEFMAEPDFAQLHGPRLAAARDVEVVLGANVTELVPDLGVGALDRVEARSLGGRKLEVRADLFVLCAGGLENARLLLASERRTPGGLGNGADLVGRYFSDHAGVPVGEIVGGDRKRLGRAFSPRRAGEIKHSPHYTATAELQRSERIVHAAAGVVYGRSPADVGAKTLVRALGRGSFAAQARREAPAAARAVLRDPGAVLRGAGRRFVLRQPGFDTAATPRLIAGGEQSPNRDSRVYLGAERDALGMRRLVLDWRVSELDLYSWRHFAELFAAELDRLGLGTARLDLSRLLDDPERTSGLVDGGHHIGTTRMAADPSAGVVDADCRVHGIENLFVAGSSVFPTGGFSNPTFTILALSLRLADRLRTMVGRAEARVGG